MRTLNLLLLILFFTSCAPTIKAKRIKFNYYEGLINHKVIMEVPDGFRLTKIYTGGEGEEHRYWYSDSSVIYISDAKGNTTFNDQLIRQQEGASGKVFLSDSIMITGEDEMGKYWCEVKYKGIVYGYSKVTTVKKQLYDKIMLSVKHK